MKNGKLHLIIGTAICLATMLLFLAFSNKLPERVPIQITASGSVGNTLPKPLFVFGVPVIFAVVNLIKGLSNAEKENPSIYSFYIIPGISILLSVAILWMALGI